MTTRNKGAERPKGEVDRGNADQTVFSDLMDQPQFKELHEISSLLRLMDSLDTGARPQYKTYVVGDTAS